MACMHECLLKSICSCFLGWSPTTSFLCNEISSPAFPSCALKSNCSGSHKCSSPDEPQYADSKRFPRSSANYLCITNFIASHSHPLFDSAKHLPNTWSSSTSLPRTVLIDAWRVPSLAKPLNTTAQWWYPGELAEYKRDIIDWSFCS